MIIFFSSYTLVTTFFSHDGLFVNCLFYLFQGPASKSLLEVEVPIVDSQSCSDALYPAPITDNMLCAGYPEGGKDSCQVNRKLYTLESVIAQKYQNQAKAHRFMKTVQPVLHKFKSFPKLHIFLIDNYGI